MSVQTHAQMNLDNDCRVSYGANESDTTCKYGLNIDDKKGSYLLAAVTGLHLRI